MDRINGLLNKGIQVVEHDIVPRATSHTRSIVSNRTQLYNLKRLDDLYIEPTANAITVQDTSRQVVGCKPTVIVGRKRVAEHKVEASYLGVGRGTSSIFPRPANNGKINSSRQPICRPFQQTW